MRGVEHQPRCAVGCMVLHALHCEGRPQYDGLLHLYARLPADWAVTRRLCSPVGLRAVRFWSPAGFWQGER